MRKRRIYEYERAKKEHTWGMLIFYVLITVYILAVNVYGFMFLRTQRDEWYDDEDRTQRGDGKLFLAGILGGATGIYAGMFLLKYRLKNLLLMVVMPVLATLNLWIFFTLYRSGFSFLLIR